MLNRIILAFVFLCSLIAGAQVTVAPFVTPQVQFFTANGLPCSGCLLSTFAAGTSTPLVTYSDSLGTVLNTNPVVLGSDGVATIYLTSASYKFVLKTAASVIIRTVDNVTWASPLSTFNGITSTGNIIAQPATAATGGANQSSPTLCIDGFYFNVTSLTDQWCLSDVLGPGPAPTSTFTVAHSGSGGAVALSFPNVAVSFGNITATGDVALSTGKVIKWNSDTGLSRDAAGVIDVGNGTQGDKSGTINLTSLKLYKSDGTVPATITNDTLGGFTLTANSGVGAGGWSFNTSGNLVFPRGGAPSIQGATSGAVTLAVPAVAGANTLTLPAATGTLARTSGDTFTSTTLTAPTLTGTSAYNRLRANQGTALVVGDVGSLTNFGTTASVSAVSGTDSAGIISIASAGTGQVANGSFVLTFHDGTWTTAPVCVGNRAEGNGPNTATVATSTSATTLAFNFDGAAVAGVTYIFNFICVGKP